MEGTVFSPFPRASMPLKIQRAQRGGRAITSCLLASLFLLFVVPPSSSFALVPTPEKPTEEGSIPASTDAPLQQSALENTVTPAEGGDGMAAPTYQAPRLSSASFALATLPAVMITKAMPAYSNDASGMQTFSSYATLGMNSLPRKVSATQAVQHGSGHEREGMGNREGLRGISGAAARHQKSYTGDLHDHVHATPLRAMTYMPTTASLPFNHNLNMLHTNSQRTSAAAFSQQSLGKIAESAGLWDTGYSLSPLQATMHSRLLHAHVNPTLCCRHDKYGVYQANPWYCSLVCRLMARKMAEKEAAKRMARRQALRTSSPRIPLASGEWFSAEEYLRLTKAVLDASKRSPVVVFTKGHCRYCKDAIKLLQDIGVKKIYVVDLGRAPDMLKLQLVLEELTGARTVPRIYIGGVCIGGLSDMTREHENGALKQRLQRAAAL